MRPALPLSLLLVLLAVPGCRSAIGDRCSSNDPCADIAGIDGGYCAKVQVCTRDCTFDQSCPTGSTCIPSDVRSVCLRSCTGDGDCNPGERCDGVCRVVDPLKPPS